MYLYNFTIVEGTSKDNLTKDNVYSYLWTEEQYNKDSNLIASAVYHRINNTQLSGQNKINILIDMLCKWLYDNTNIKQIDRVFEPIEREIKRKDVIVAIEQVFKPPGQWHFKFMETKRILLRHSQNDASKILVCGEIYYKANTGSKVYVDEISVKEW